MLKRRWLAVALIVLLAAAGYWYVSHWRYRFVHSNVDLLRLVPAADRTLFYADVETLRREGYLKLLSTSKRAEDYEQFVRATGFDYTRDLNAIAGASDGKQIWLVARGHFEWAKVRGYAESHGTAQGAIRSRAIQPDVLALAIGPESGALEQIQPNASTAQSPSVAPLWIRPSQNVLRNPSALPLPVRIFAISLQSADSVVLALEPSRSREVAFVLSVTADFKNRSMADSARTQLTGSTTLLRQELAREHQQPSPRDLTGMLASGAFEVSGSRLRALWPVRRELLQALE